MHKSITTFCWLTTRDYKKLHEIYKGGGDTGNPVIIYTTAYRFLANIHTCTTPVPVTAAMPEPTQKKRPPLQR
jgi:hypothetical protein